MRPVLVPLTEAAADRLQRFREDCQTWGEAEGAPVLLVSHLGKMSGMVARVALVLAHLDWAAQGEGAPPTQVEEREVERACHLVGTVLRAHAERVYSAGEAPEVGAARLVARLIRDERPETISPREVQRRNLAGLRTAPEIRRAFDVLVQAGWLAPARCEPTGGNPRVIYAVSPRVLAD